MIKSARRFDVHDWDVPPAVYQLMFAQELVGNDQWYCIRPDELLEFGSPEAWKERMDRGPNNCYFDADAMKQFFASNPTYEQAIALFHAWLKKRNIPIDEPIFVKIWW